MAQISAINNQKVSSILKEVKKNGVDKTMNPKKFLFVSIDGLIGDIAWQIVKEGHEVKYFI